MKTMMARIAQALLVAAIFGLGGAAVSHVSAQGGAGWYGPYDHGCYLYSNDGVTLAAFSYCPVSDGSGGWYGPFENGCYYFTNDGSTLTGYRYCPSGLGEGFGWWGPFEDGCLYDWEATGWTGAAYCPTPTTTTSEPTGPQGDTLTTDPNGVPAVIWADGTVMSMAPGTSACGGACQPQTGFVTPVPIDNGVGIWVEPRTQPEYSPGCEAPVTRTCFGFP